MLGRGEEDAMTELLESLGPFWAALMLLLVVALGIGLTVLGATGVIRQRRRHA
jgi:hypothetical protein